MVGKSHILRATETMEGTKDEKKNHQKCNMIKYNLYSFNDESTKIFY